MADQGIKILILQDLDLGLETRMLPIQCLLSKLRQSCAPFKQEAITAIVAQALPGER